MLDGRVCKREGGSLSNNSTNPDKLLARFFALGTVSCEKDARDLILSGGAGDPVGLGSFPPITRSPSVEWCLP